jgi:hypothetical protein
MLCASVCMVVAPCGVAVKLQTPGSVRLVRLPGQLAPRLTAELTSKRHRPVTEHTVSGTDRPAQCPQTRVSPVSDAVVCGSGTTGLHTVVSTATLHGPSSRCRPMG